ncbi:MAG: hypothetical protein LBL05_04880, partial [Synergistaceae bacterium]|nr:hypothetical protein [Synergistaceae bacterium]
MIVRNSLPQDIEPIAKNIIPDDLEKLCGTGLSNDRIRDIITYIMSGESYTVSSESGAIGFAYGLVDALETCALPQGKTIMYVPFWIIETTALPGLEKEFFEELRNSIGVLHRKTMGFPITFLVNPQKTNRVRYLQELAFTYVKQIRRNGRNFELY